VTFVISPSIEATSNNKNLNTTQEGPRRTPKAAAILSSVGTNYRKGLEGKVKVQHSPG
jgi:hypothetical protein